MKKTRSLKRTQTVFHLLPHVACLFSARFFRGGFFFYQIPTQNLTKQKKQPIVNKFFSAAFYHATT
jgi:hypothetical protein